MVESKESKRVERIGRVEHMGEERVTVPEVAKDRPVEEVQLARTPAFLITLLDCCCCCCATEGLLLPSLPSLPLRGRTEEHATN